MNKENASKLWKMIQEAGDYLQGEFYLAATPTKQPATVIRQLE